MAHYDEYYEIYETSVGNIEAIPTPLRDDNGEVTKGSKYVKVLPTHLKTVDVYDVLKLFDVQDPAIQHAIKKLLCTGLRGHKSYQEDLEEALFSIERAIQLNSY